RLRLSWLDHALPNDVGGALVVAQAEVHRVSQLVVIRPFRETHLGDQLGPNPVRRLVRLDTFAERGQRDLARAQQFRDALELALIEAGSSMSHVREAPVPAVTGVDAQQ